MLQHCIYVLFSEKDHLLYIGYTTDVEARVRKHNEGGVKSTKGRRPLIVVFYEYYLFKEDALKREGYLKPAQVKKHSSLC